MPAGTPSREEHLRLIQTWYGQMWNRWDTTVFPAILQPTITFRGSLGQVKHGYAGLAEYIEFVRQAFPDFHNRLDLIISEDDKAFAQLTYTGTHQGEIFGVPPTGKVIEYAGAAVFTFAQGKIAEVWVLGDLYGLLQQLQE
jgi:steroid delta-isomerase-like uncharacterized protein